MAATTATASKSREAAGVGWAVGADSIGEGTKKAWVGSVDGMAFAVGVSGVECAAGEGRMCIG